MTDNPEKLGIHPSDWERVVKQIKEQIPEPYASIIIRILERLATRFI